MEINIKKFIEQSVQEKIVKPKSLYNPEGMDFKNRHRIKSIEATEEYTRIDFIYRSSMIYINGGWFQMNQGAYIQPLGSKKKYGLIKAIGIPIAPQKYYFRRQGECHTYTLIFEALPKNTSKIDIIEKKGCKNCFNFFNVNFSKWMTIPFAADLPISYN
jgi:hypothetical protein